MGASICLIVMSLGYAGFGRSVEDNIIMGLGTVAQGDYSWSCIAGSFSFIGILINLLISCPILFFCFISFFESAGNTIVHTPMTPANIVFRASVMLFLIYVGANFGYPKELIGLSSSAFGSINAIFIPLAC